MRTPDIVLAAGAALVLGIANASAGPCNQAIMDVTKQLAATDAGSGGQAPVAPGRWPVTKKVSILVPH